MRDIPTTGNLPAAAGITWRYVIVLRKHSGRSSCHRADRNIWRRSIERCAKSIANAKEAMKWHRPELFGTLFRAPLLCLAASLSACSVNPLVDVPDGPSEAAVTTMASALARAQQLKSGYRKKAYDFVGNQIAINDAMLGLGVLTIGLAASTAHPDTYRTTAFGTGALYLFANQNSVKARFDIYQAGIGAVNCATLASSPLQISDVELLSIRAEITATKAKLPALAQSIARAQAEHANVVSALDTITAQRVEDQISRARKSHDTALAALGDAGLLPSQVGLVAKQLKATLDVIEGQVTKSLAGTVQDPAAVQQSLTSLVAVVSRGAPGLQLDKFFNARIAGRAEAQGGNAATTRIVSSALKNALIDLALRQTELDVEAVPLAQRLSPYKGHTEASAAALKSCGISETLTGLRVDRDEIRFTSGAEDIQTATIVVSGGVKNYTARFRESPTNGVEVQSPLAGDSTVQVRVPKTVKAGTNLTLLVMDSSNPSQSKEVRIVVESGAKNASKNAEISTVAADLLPVEQAVKELIKAGKATTFTPSGSVNTYTLIGTSGQGDELLISMTCKAGRQGKKDGFDTLRKAIIQHSITNKALAADPGPEMRQRLVPSGDIGKCAT